MIHRQFFAQNRTSFAPVLYSAYTFNDTGGVPFSGTRPIVSLPANNGVFLAYSDGYNYGDGYIQWASPINTETGAITLLPRVSLSSMPVNDIDVIKEDVGPNTYFYVGTLEYAISGTRYVKLYAIAETYEGATPIENKQTVATFSSENIPHICIAGESNAIWVFYDGGCKIYTMDTSLTFVRVRIVDTGTYKKAISVGDLTSALVYQDGTDVKLRIFFYNIPTFSIVTVSTITIGSFTLSNEFQNISIKLIDDKLLVILDSTVTHVILIDISDTASPVILQTKSYSDYIFNSMAIDAINPNVVFWTYSYLGEQKIRKITINSSSINVSMPIELPISCGCNSIRTFNGYNKGVLSYEDNDDYSSGKLRLIDLQ